MLVDLGEDAKSPMASLARASYGEYIRKIPDYVRETFAFNQLLGYWKVVYHTEPSAKEIIGLIASEFNTGDFKMYFRIALDSLLPAMKDDDGRQDKMVEDIIKTERHPFNQLVEIISYARLGFHFEYATQLVGSTLMRNTDYGLIRSGRGRWPSAQPRFAMGSRLLETLVLLALLDGEPGSYHTRPCTIDYLVDWLAERYGIYINPLQAGATSGDAYPACRANLETLKGRLRSIGYYADLSDASNAQTINPRYRID